MRTFIKMIIGCCIFIFCKFFFLESLLIKIFNRYNNMLDRKNIFLRRIFFLYYNFLFFINDKKLDRFIYKCYLKTSNDGLEIAKYYYGVNNFLKKKNIGKLNYFEAVPIFDCFKNNIKIILKKNKTGVNLIQIGSSSGRDLEYLNYLEPKINYISTDLTDKILNFQRSVLKINNIMYFKTSAENIDRILSIKEISNKCNIIFANGSIQYLPPYNFERFLNNLKKSKNIYFLSCQPIHENFIEKKLSFDLRGNFSFQYDYKHYLEKNDFKILEKKIFYPYDHTHINFKTGHYFVFAFKQ